MHKHDTLIDWLLVMLLLLAVAQCTAARAMDLDEVVHHQRADEQRFFGSCLRDSVQWESMHLDHVSKATLTITCMFAWRYGYKAYFTSTLRGDARQLIGTQPQAHIPYRRSRHDIGMAADVVFTPVWAESVPLSERAKLLLYRKTLQDYHQFLLENKLTGIVTESCYPHQRTPFIHIDARGKRASWGRIEGTGDSYISYAACLKWIEEKLKNNP